MCAVHEPKFGQYQNFGGAVTLSGVPRYMAPSYPYHSGHTPQTAASISAFTRLYFTSREELWFCTAKVR